MSTEIDRIMAKIAQDNKILAELDKSRATIGKNGAYIFNFDNQSMCLSNLKKYD